MLRLDLVTLVVDDYDRALRYYVDVLGFTLTDDIPMGPDKRWVVVRPDARGAGFLLAKAASPAQVSAIGQQTGGRVGFFLHTDAIETRVREWTAKGVDFTEVLRHEPYGRVIVFMDLYGNRWDLIEPAG